MDVGYTAYAGIQEPSELRLQALVASSLRSAATEDSLRWTVVEFFAALRILLESQKRNPCRDGWFPAFL